MTFNRPHSYFLGALSAVALGLSAMSGAYAEPAAITAAQTNTNMVLALGERINSEVSHYMDSAMVVYKDSATTDDKAKIESIVALAKSAVKKVPESVPSLLAETKKNLPQNYYESVRIAVTEVVAGKASLAETERVNNTDQAAQGVADTRGKSGNQDWLNYKMKVNMGGRTQMVVWSPTQWKNQWWPSNVTKASQKAWKIAVFNNKYLTIKPLSATQTASLWGSWGNMQQMDAWIPGIAHTASGDALNKTVLAFLNPRYLKLLEKVRGGGIEVAQVTQLVLPPVVRVNVNAINAVVDAAIVGITPPVSDPNVSPN